MQLHYLDTSFLVPYYLPEATSEAVERKLRLLPVGSLIISPLVRAEFASLLCRKCRHREMSEADAHRTMTALDRHLSTGALQAVAVLSDDFYQATAWIMVMKHPLRAPDALHLAVAARQEAVFWTLDRSLARAARWLGLEVRK
ncbi:MAG: type II toxin-antitoxin system VapC family toxin [Deltaproteobacteria bacterium]|nr:type II toxin-antitoxin system VapC family toxin [Deltaproteobacteria bacterium]MBW2072857.1 type II toxin-antitoxin system VapC family toxin [Deltaproteobacteria bacterium]